MRNSLNIALISAIESEKIESVRALILAEAPLNDHQLAGTGELNKAPPIFQAIRYNNLPILTLLLDAGADLSITTDREFNFAKNIKDDPKLLLPPGNPIKIASLLGHYDLVTAIANEITKRNKATERLKAQAAIINESEQKKLVTTGEEMVERSRLYGLFNQPIRDEAAHKSQQPQEKYSLQAEEIRQRSCIEVDKNTSEKTLTTMKEGLNNPIFGQLITQPRKQTDANELLKL